MRKPLEIPVPTAEELKALVEKHPTGTIYVTWDNANMHEDDSVGWASLMTSITSKSSATTGAKTCFSRSFALAFPALSFSPPLLSILSSLAVREYFPTVT